MIPEIFKTNPPRAIQFKDELFSKNRNKSINTMLYAPIILPGFALILWLGFNDLKSGLIWGASITAFAEIFALGMLLNAKKAVNLCRNGILTSGMVTKVSTPGSNTKNSTSPSAKYIFIDIDYQTKSGLPFHGQVFFVGSSNEIDLDEEDHVPILYLDNKPENFILYSESLGISTIGTAKNIA